MLNPEYNIEQIGVVVLIVALDTTTRSGSLAVVRGGRVLVEAAGDAALTHAQRLPLEIARVCDAAQVALADVDLFAVAAGPGSFTGLRIGIATVQGLAIAMGRLVTAVSTLEAIVEAAGRPESRVAAWMDAQRHEVFAELPGIGPPVSASPASVLAAWQARTSLDDVEFHGDGAIRYAEVIRGALGSGARIATAVPLLAGAIGRLAAAAPERAIRPHAIVPIYVRRPDAEIARDRKSARE